MTADPTNWTDLKASLANWINRDDLGATEIPEAIALAERRFNRALRVPEMEDVVSGSTVAGTITLPGDFLSARAVYLATDPKVTLEPMTLAELRTSFPAGVSGQPRNFAIQSGSEMVFGPAPDGIYEVILNYYQKIPALGETQPTNWLLTDHPDIYLAAALAELFDILRDERADRCELKLKGRIEELNAQGRRKAFSAAPLRIRSPLVV